MEFFTLVAMRSFAAGNLGEHVLCLKDSTDEAGSDWLREGCRWMEMG